MTNMLIRNVKKDTLDKIHHGIVKVLSEKGIRFENEQAREVFAAHGARIENDVVYITEELLNKALSTVPKSFVLKGRESRYDVEVGNGKPVFCPAYGPVYVSRHNERRLGLAEDLIAFSKLTQNSEVLNIMNPYVLTPTDVPSDKLYLLQQAACLKYGAKPNMLMTAGYQVTKECIKLVKSINSHSPDDYVAVGLISSLSPLAYDESMAGAIIALAEEKQPIILGCYGLLGATAPITFMGALITTQAEALAGIILAQLISPGVPCLTGNVSGGSDMRFITPAIGSAEECKFATYTKALADYYGFPCRGGGALSDANQMDYQAGSESMMVMYTTLAAEMDYIIHAVGILDSFNIIGYEKFLLDEQTIETITYALTESPTDDESFALDLIKEVPHGAQYIEHEHTYMNMREAQYNPKLSLRGYYDVWEKEGAPTLLDQVNIALDKRLAEFTLPELDDEKTALLDKLLKF